MSSIKLESEGIFCPQCGSVMNNLDLNLKKQYRCLEDPEHYATDNKIKTYSKVILK